MHHTPLVSSRGTGSRVLFVIAQLFILAFGVYLGIVLRHVYYRHGDTFQTPPLTHDVIVRPDCQYVEPPQSQTQPVTADMCNSHEYSFLSPSNYWDLREQVIPGVLFPKGFRSGIVMHNSELTSYNSCSSFTHVNAKAKGNCHIIVPVDDQDATPYIYRAKGPRTGAMRTRSTSHSKAIKASTQEQFKTLQQLDDLVTSFARLAESQGVRPGDDVVIMCLNDAMMDLLLNMQCSQQRHMIDVSRQTFIFATSESGAAKLRAIGMNGFYHEGLGEFPNDAARTYGDNIFARMMMLKIICVHVAMANGFNVLFQDVDIVWFQDPFQYLRNQPEHVDIFFQDDGARTERYAPFYGNSGFYYVRNNWKTQRLFQRFLLSVERVAATHSHQEVLSFLVMEEYDVTGLNVKILPDREFCQGEMYHHQKSVVRQILQGVAPQPYIFHMCWTANKVDKLQFMSELGIWYLKPECTEQSLKQNDELVMEDCCAQDDPLLHFQLGRPYVWRSK